MFKTIRDRLFAEVNEEVEEQQSITSEYILGTPLYTSSVFDNVLYRKYITKASRLIPNVTEWAYNRAIDHTHVQSIIDELSSMKDPHLLGSFKIVKSFDDLQLPKILDGHHRRLALMHLLREREGFDMDIDVDVYLVEGDLERCDGQLRQLFIKANKNLNVSLEDIPEVSVIDLVDKFIERWPRNIKTDESREAHRPNITKRRLVAYLKPIVESELGRRLGPEALFARILKINEEIRLTPVTVLLGSRGGTARRVRCLEKAHTTGFYLNLECTRGIDVWTRELLG